MTDTDQGGDDATHESEGGDGDSDSSDDTHVRYVGIDFGDKRIGVAVSDPLGITAQPVRTITLATAGDTAAAIPELTAIATEHGAEAFVVGLPLNMDGSEGPAATAAIAFGNKLAEATGLPAILWDERLSTAEAHGYLRMTGTRNKKRKQIVDTLAAQIILQSYLDAGCPREESDQ